MGFVIVTCLTYSLCINCKVHIASNVNCYDACENLQSVIMAYLKAYYDILLQGAKKNEKDTHQDIRTILRYSTALISSLLHQCCISHCPLSQAQLIHTTFRELAAQPTICRREQSTPETSYMSNTFQAVEIVENNIVIMR